MARSPEGRRLRKDPRTGIWLVRWIDADGVRRNRSTGERARRQAEAAADRICREARPRRVGRGESPLDVALAAWLVAFSASHSPETVEAYQMYAGVHWFTRWSSVEQLDAHRLAEYVRDRLRVVTASTVRKEASALRAFLAWLVEDGQLDVAPTVPSVPKRATGTPYQGGKRTPRRVPLSAPQVAAIVAAMPPGDARDVVELVWETTLRIATILALERPRHYRPGAAELVITADVDKARMARRLPLSPRAAAILDHRAAKDGRLFPVRVAWRHYLARAAEVAGIATDDAVRVSPHDLRHAAITDLVSRPGVPLGGTAYLAGHRHVSTTALYAHPGQEAAAAAIAARIGTPDGTRAPKATKARKRRPKESPAD